MIDMKSWVKPLAVVISVYLVLSGVAAVILNQTVIQDRCQEMQEMKEAAETIGSDISGSINAECPTIVDTYGSVVFYQPAERVFESLVTFTIALVSIISGVLFSRFYGDL